MNWTTAKTVVTSLCLVSISVLLSGCLVCSSSSVKYGAKGAMVSQETLDQIEPGKTSKAELIAILGKPTIKRAVSDASELYIYDYVKTTRGSVAVFLLLAMNDRDEKRSRLYFIIEDGVVRKFWKDSSVG